MSSQRVEPGGEPDGTTPEQRHPPAHLRDPLSIVRPGVPDVVLAFSEGSRTETSWTRLRPRRRWVPAGVVHAAVPLATETLCGRPVAALHELGRSRYPFEAFPGSYRCRDCDEAAGHPDVLSQLGGG